MRTRAPPAPTLQNVLVSHPSASAQAGTVATPDDFLAAAVLAADENHDLSRRRGVLARVQRKWHNLWHRRSSRRRDTDNNNNNNNANNNNTNALAALRLRATRPARQVLAPPVDFDQHTQIAPFHSTSDNSSPTSQINNALSSNLPASSLAQQQQQQQKLHTLRKSQQNLQRQQSQKQQHQYADQSNQPQQQISHLDQQQQYTGDTHPTSSTTDAYTASYVVPNQSQIQQTSSIVPNPSPFSIAPATSQVVLSRERHLRAEREEQMALERAADDDLLDELTVSSSREPGRRVRQVGAREGDDTLLELPRVASVSLSPSPSLSPTSSSRPPSDSGGAPISLVSSGAVGVMGTGMKTGAKVRQLPRVSGIMPTRPVRAPYEGDDSSRRSSRSRVLPVPYDNRSDETSERDNNDHGGDDDNDDDDDDDDEYDSEEEMEFQRQREREEEEEAIRLEQLQQQQQYQQQRRQLRLRTSDEDSFRAVEDDIDDNDDNDNDDDETIENEINIEDDDDDDDDDFINERDVDQQVDDDDIEDDDNDDEHDNTGHVRLHGRDRPDGENRYRLPRVAARMQRMPITRLPTGMSKRDVEREMERAVVEIASDEGESDDSGSSGGGESKEQRLDEEEEGSTNTDTNTNLQNMVQGEGLGVVSNDPCDIGAARHRPEEQRPHRLSHPILHQQHQQLHPDATPSKSIDYNGYSGGGGSALSRWTPLPARPPRNGSERPPLGPNRTRRSRDDDVNIDRQRQAGSMRLRQRDGSKVRSRSDAHDGRPGSDSGFARRLSSLRQHQKVGDNQPSKQIEQPQQEHQQQQQVVTLPPHPNQANVGSFTPSSVSGGGGNALLGQVSSSSSTSGPLSGRSRSKSQPGSAFRRGSKNLFNPKSIISNQQSKNNNAMMMIMMNVGAGATSAAAAALAAERRSETSSTTSSSSSPADLMSHNYHKRRHASQPTSNDVALFEDDYLSFQGFHGNSGSNSSGGSSNNSSSGGSKSVDSRTLQQYYASIGGIPGVGALLRSKRISSVTDSHSDDSEDAGPHITMRSRSESLTRRHKHIDRISSAVAPTPGGGSGRSGRIPMFLRKWSLLEENTREYVV